MSLAQDYAHAHFDQALADLFELLRMRSVSTDSAFAPEVLRTADWLLHRMTRIGLSAELVSMPEGTYPLVIGRWNGAGANAKTVLIYGHYDVQPATLEDGWDSDPFIPVERDGIIYARGASDSKVNVVTQLNAIEALLATNSCPVNLILLLEGEEESGGQTVSAYLRKHADQIPADVVVISDGGIRSPEQPSLVYGLRGIITLELHVFGAQQDLHSGHFGGTVHNPLQALAEILAQLHDAEGRVAVEGFYDNVATLEAEERQLLALSDLSFEQEWDEIAHAPQQWGEAEFSLHERIGARPTLELNGMAGGYYGAGFKTVLPESAYAKISCRLVPHQDPHRIAELVQAQIRKLAPPSVRIEFRHVDAEAPAVLLERRGFAMQSAYRAYEKGWGVAPVWERVGGSVPITSEMFQVSPNVVIMGYSYKGGRAHGQNENIPRAMLAKAIPTAIYFLQEIAQATV